MRDIAGLFHSCARCALCYPRHNPLDILYQALNMISDSKEREHVRSCVVVYWFTVKEQWPFPFPRHLKERYILMRKSVKQYIYDLCDKALRDGEAFFNIEEGVDWSDVVASFSAECLKRNAISREFHYKCTSTNDKVTVTCQRKNVPNVDPLHRPVHLDALPNDSFQ